MEVQREIDFSRAEQLAILRDCELLVGYVEGKRITAGYQKAVLKAIDDYARESGACFASLDTIAKKCNRQRRHIGRAITWLVDDGLLFCDRRKSKYGPTMNHYSILWADLALRCPGRLTRTNVPQGPTNVPQGPTNVPQGPTNVPQGHMPCDPGAHKAQFLSAPKKPPPPSALPKTEWLEVEGLLRSHGCLAGGRALAKARERGATVEQVREIVDYFASRTPAWAAGALYRRVEWAYEGQPVAEGWPPARGVRQTNDAAERSQQFAREREQSSSERQEIAALEAAYGPALDAMLSFQRREFAQRVLSEFQFACWCRSGGKTGRYDLLVQMHAEACETRRTAEAI